MFRHVDFDRSDQALNNFNIFMDEVLGQKYGLDIRKISK